MPTQRSEQPLPLPKGVSDYAVGNGIFAARAKTKCYLAPSAVGSAALQGNQLLKEEGLECKQDYDIAESEASHTSDELVFIKMGDVNVSEGLSKQVVQELLEKKIRSIDECYKKTSRGTTGLTKEVVATLTVDPTGHVIQVHIDKNKIIVINPTYSLFILFSS